MANSNDTGYFVKLRGLPFSTTPEGIVNFFDDVNIEGGKDGVHITELWPGRPSGEAFVELASEEDLEAALKKDREYMGKRYIEVCKSEKSEMDWFLKHENGDGDTPEIDPNVSVVKLRGLPFGCTKEEIVQFFDGLEVAGGGVTILLDHTGRSSGEAFVQFVDDETALRALQKDREKIGHRYIEVFRSSAKEMYQYMTRKGGAGGGFTGERSIMGGGRPARGGGGNWGGRPAPYEVPERFGGPVGGRFGAARGRGGYRGGGGGGGGMGLGGSDWNNGGGGGGGGNMWGGGGGGGGLGGHSVHMRGLPFKATLADIAFFFKPLRPVSITICYDNKGRPSGEADVVFECHDDARFAMKHDKTHMEHRYIELFLNSSPMGGGLGGGGGAPRGRGGFRNFRN